MGNSLNTGKFLTAAETGDTVQVKKLIKNNKNVNVKSRGGWTALMKAAKSGHLETVQVLIDANADVNATNRVGRTALMFACEKGLTKVVQILIDANADVNAQDFNFNQTVLMRAVGHGHREIVQLLIDANVDVSPIDSKSRTALMMASTKGLTLNAQVNHNNSEIIKLLSGPVGGVRCKECGTMNVRRSQLCIACGMNFF